MIKIKLSDIAENSAVFHNLKYTNDRCGGNRNRMTFEVTNLSGNSITVEIAQYVSDPLKKTYSLKWNQHPVEVEAIRITIQGSCENSEFLNMLKLIVNTEKILDIVE